MENIYKLNKIFTSIDGKHKIEISLMDNVAWFNIKNIEYEFYKTFLDLLKDIMKYLSLNNISIIKQYVLENDLEFFKNSDKIHLNEDIYVINTSIDKFIPELINVLGINLL